VAQQLNQEVRHLFRVVNIGGSPVTGLTGVDFTSTVQRQSGTDPDMTLTADAASVSIDELDAGGLPGWFWAYYTPTTDVGIHLLQVVEGAFTGSLGVQHRWEDLVESGTAVAAGPYLTTRANVKTALMITATDDDGRIDALLAQVTDFFHVYARRNFLSATLTQFYNGNGSRVLNLRRYPVSAVTSVHENLDEPRVYGASDLLVANTDYDFNSANGILYRFGGTWPSGWKTVKVVYTGGYATIPGDLERAAIEVIAAKMEKGRTRSYHVTAESHQDGSVSGIVANDLTPSARRVLERYSLPERFIA
jgi:hypothetical protein